MRSIHLVTDRYPGRAPFDAQKSAASTHDLRGKILRIRPNPDGSYDIPPGNLFPPDGSGKETLIPGDRRRQARETHPEKRFLAGQDPVR